MRISHWLLLATAVVFFGSVVVARQPAAGQTAKPAPAAAPQAPKPAAPAAPTAQAAPAAARSVGPSTPRAVVPIIEIMHAIIEPASTVVFDAVATTIDASGIHEKVPSTDEEWDMVLHAAITLTEAPNLLMIPGRTREVGGKIPAKDWTDWNRKARELVQAGEVALKAARAKDAAKLLDAGERIDVACDACHEPYQKVEIPEDEAAKK
jgi:hypothetical protein